MAVTYVVDGAKIKCSQGIGLSTLQKIVDHTVYLHDKTFLTVADNKAYGNIKPFSLCRSPQNPSVIAAQGKPSTCNPSICMKWMNGKTDLTIKGEQVLKSDCKLSCLFGGIIEIADDGQRK